jgi:hypothetical protein
MKEETLLFTELDGQLVTSNDSVIFYAFNGKKGKANSRDMISFAANLFGLKLDFNESFDATYEAKNMMMHGEEVSEKDRQIAYSLFSELTRDELTSLIEKIKTQDLSSDETHKHFHATYNDLSRKFGEAFFRTVIYRKILTDCFEEFYDYAISK